MRNLGTATKVAAAGAEDVGRKGAMSLETMAKGATRAGGEMGKMFGAAGAALGGLNPIALAAGMGVGFITTKVFELIEGIQRAKEAAGSMKTALEAAPGELRSKDIERVKAIDVDKRMGESLAVPIEGLTTDQRKAVESVFNKGGTAREAQRAAIEAAPQGALGRMLSPEAAQGIHDSWYKNETNPTIQGLRKARGIQQAEESSKKTEDDRSAQRLAGIHSDFTKPTSGDLISSSSVLASEVERAAKAVEEARRGLEAQNARGGRWSWEIGAEREYRRAEQSRDELNARIERRAAQDY